MTTIAVHHLLNDSFKKALIKKKLPHSLILSGGSASQRMDLALLLAQTLNCESLKNNLSCGQCLRCRQISTQKSEDLLIVQVEGSTLKIEHVRPVLDELSLKNWGSSRIVIFEEAHTMTLSAANSLLKILEEPPTSTWFMLLTSQPHKLIQTIRSRCIMLSLPREAVVVFESEKVERAFQLLDSHRYDDLKLITQRPEALETVRIWLEALRVEFRSRSLESSSQPPYYKTPKTFENKSWAELYKISQAVIELEQNIQQNADFGLAIENFLRNTLYAKMD